MAKSLRMGGKNLQTKADRKQKANEKRLAAVRALKEQSTSRTKLAISSKTSKTTKHIVFDSSDDQPPPKSSPSRETKSAPDTVVQKLFGSDDSESDDAADFGLRREFEGHSGHKLLHLQHQSGGDKRFRLSEKFLENDPDYSGLNRAKEGEEESGNGDEITQQMQQEKAKALSIINTILGPSRPDQWTASRPQGDKPLANSMTLIKDVFPSRYDPKLAASTQLEQHPSASEVESADEGSGMDNEDTMTPQPGVEVSSEQYFSVAQDLHAGFAASSERPFSFLAEFGSATENDREIETQIVASETTLLKPRWMDRLDQASSQNDDHTTNEDDEMTSGTQARQRLLFFFHSNNPELSNRLDENTFFRTKSLRELEKGWAERRTALKKTFRQRHREAVKLARRKRKHFAL